MNPPKMKLTLEEKRRETLRSQLFGKEEAAQKSDIRHQISDESKQAKDNRTFSLASQPTSTLYTLPTTTYLAKDLTKVLAFSVLAIGTQLTLYFLLQNHLIKLQF